jgi:UDP-N-acetylmuramyl pentapeptide phosphotransferase/UDP-N-acetylglucosamine-1-phosphate transferase
VLAQSFAVASLILTAFVITGLTNAFNIIDGLNGSRLGLRHDHPGRHRVRRLSWSTIYWVAAFAAVALGAIAGFFVWNYPGGYIFLGDGGAYLCGFHGVRARPGTCWPATRARCRRSSRLLLCIYPGG